MRNVAKFLCFLFANFVAMNAYAVVEVIDETLYIGVGDTYDADIEIISGGPYYRIVNRGEITGTINIQTGAAAVIQNFGVISGTVNCNDGSGNGTCVNIQQIITGDIDDVSGRDDMNPIPGLAHHTVIVQNSVPGISLADIIAVAGDAYEIELTHHGVVVDVGISDTHPTIFLDSITALNFIVHGLPVTWDSSVPVLTGISNHSGGHDVKVAGVDSMYLARGWISGDGLYVSLRRQTNYGIVLENATGGFLDDLRAQNPDDKLIGALDNAWTRAELNDVLSRSMRTNPINLMDPLRSFNTFVLGEYIHDLAFGIVAEPFYIYSSDFSVIGGGVGVSGTVAKNMIAKFGVYAGKMDYNGDLDDFSGMIYGANLGAMYKDSDFYARAVGVLSSVKFDDIDIFDGARAVSNPTGISAAAIVDGGLVFRLWNEFDVTPFVGARFDYAKVAGSNDSDTNLRFGVNVDKETTVDGNRYAFGLQALAQTDSEIYGAIYTDIMSVVDGVGGRLQFGILHDDFGMSYKISLDAKFVF